MTRRILTSAMVLSMSLFTVGISSAAPVVHTYAPVDAKVKMISFSIRNDSAAPLTIKGGDQQMTIAPGKTAALKLQRGSSVTTVNETSHLPAGAVLTTVTDELQGNTVAVS